ncbi:hypothetical protein CHELA40_10641 [Chelatococcus asaccharovorans]|nr:hypothetical protein CHELA40_10641 [Chelatococcus asaccharovorans]
MGRAFLAIVSPFMPVAADVVGAVPIRHATGSLCFVVVRNSGFSLRRHSFTASNNVMGMPQAAQPDGIRR